MGTRIDIPRDGCVRHRSSAAFGASLAAVVCFGCGIGAWIANVAAAGADGSKPDQKVLAQGASSSTANGCRAIRAATVETVSGPYTTIARALPAITWADPAVAGRPARMSTSSPPRPTARR